MKTKILLLVGILAMGRAQAQYCWDNINTITTKPGATGSLNTFDWTQELASAYLKDDNNPATGTAPPFSITLPMYAQGSASAFNNLNLTDLQDLAPSLKDHKPEDGWELLIKEFGLPGPPIDKNVENPFFALYNRYTGKIRVFFMLTSKAASLNLTGAYLELSFLNSPRRTALLQHVSPIGKPVVFLETQSSMRVPNYLDNRDRYWFFADFPAAYDPCSCGMTELSRITIRLIANEDALIEAKINGKLYENAVINMHPGTSTNAIGMNGYWGPNEQMVIQGLQKGFESYKTFDGYRKNFEKGIGEVDDYLVRKIDTMLKKRHPGGITLPGVSGTVAPNVEALKKSKEGVQFLQGLGYGANQLEAFKSVASAVPYVGAAIGLIDFFTNLSKPNKTDAPLPTPTTYSVDMTLNGTIKKTNPITTYSFATPGSRTGPPGNGIPDYNNILGVVNILDIPTLEYVQYAPKAPSWNPYQLSSINAAAAEFIPNIRQYRMSGDLKYVLNPAANLELISAEATYILEFGSDSGKVIFRRPPYSTNLWRDVDQMPVEFGRPDSHADNIPQRMEDAGWETDYLSSGYFDYMANSGAQKPAQGKYRIRTPYAPIQCMRNVAFNMYYHTKTDPNQTSNDICCRNKTPDIILKVVFKLRKKNRVDDDVTTIIMSYDMSKAKEEAQPAPGYSNLYYNLDRYLEPNSPIYNYYPHSFESDPVFPTLINAPKNITLEQVSVNKNLYARDTIIIKDNVFLGNNVHLYAGSMIATNATFFSPATGNSSLNISRYIPCDGTLESAHESKAGILAKCQSQAYRDRALARPADPAPVEATIMADNFFIYPNPTNDQLFIRFMSPEETRTDISVYDATGRKLYSAGHKLIGTAPYAVDVKKFAPGVYIMHLSRADGTKQVFKFVKQ
ncbi:T9SS type A sorting domain-containing protein [Taibaiella chishuiensis]|uniref:Putative secreted protein (Por secretion system target) n=1 Tax=Taibaiella chishuiensis TaxID=1434707 RepID=A0A2P8CV96_9BACT|nr:T9SS type A sorting domain-containing protein [Taibaiella chishuiensis]PSK88893.1 putative secreted protein (Por secretion system target) [Taibaiella chishuiensis]